MQLLIPSIRRLFLGLKRPRVYPLGPTTPVEPVTHVPEEPIHYRYVFEVDAVFNSMDLYKEAQDGMRTQGITINLREVPELWSQLSIDHWKPRRSLEVLLALAEADDDTIQLLELKPRYRHVARASLRYPLDQLDRVLQRLTGTSERFFDVDVPQGLVRLSCVIRPAHRV